MSKRDKLQIKMYQAGMTGSDLSKATGYTRSHISRVINGKHEGGILFWNKAAIALRCNVTDIK